MSVREEDLEANASTTLEFLLYQKQVSAKLTKIIEDFVATEIDPADGILSRKSREAFIDQVVTRVLTDYIVELRMKSLGMTPPEKDWRAVPFKDYLEAVDESLERITGSPSSLADADDIAWAQKIGDSPDLYVQYTLPEHLR